MVEEEDEEVEKAMAAGTTSRQASQDQSEANMASNSSSSLGLAASTSSLAIQPRLMQKISAKKEVTEETLLDGSDVPPYGVKTEYPNDLEKVSQICIHYSLGYYVLPNIFNKNSLIVRPLD